MVRSSMMKLNKEMVVEQIEEKVGSDLQYIRLNGAVVGYCWYCNCSLNYFRYKFHT
jgi:uncharacterized membrane-anchored protein YjiN (DUF445 family)